jgi:hypothetical protein
MIVGFTGSSDALARAQYTALESLIARLDYEGPINEAHHGDCVGADFAFDYLCSELGIIRHAHPGHDRAGLSPHRGHCDAEVIHPAKWYIDRNHDIVAAADVLIACPSGPELRRSGTWATVRHAHVQGVPVILVWPNGQVHR